MRLEGRECEEWTASIERQLVELQGRQKIDSAKPRHARVRRKSWMQEDIHLPRSSISLPSSQHGHRRAARSPDFVAQKCGVKPWATSAPGASPLSTSKQLHSPSTNALTSPAHYPFTARKISTSPRTEPSYSAHSLLPRQSSSGAPTNTYVGKFFSPSSPAASPLTSRLVLPGSATRRAQKFLLSPPGHCTLESPGANVAFTEIAGSLRVVSGDPELDQSRHHSEMESKQKIEAVVAENVARRFDLMKRLNQQQVVYHSSHFDMLLQKASPLHSPESVPGVDHAGPDSIIHSPVHLGIPVSPGLPCSLFQGGSNSHVLVQPSVAPSMSPSPPLCSPTSVSGSQPLTASSIEAEPQHCVDDNPSNHITMDQAAVLDATKVEPLPVQPEADGIFALVDLLQQDAPTTVTSPQPARPDPGPAGPEAAVLSDPAVQAPDHSDAPLQAGTSTHQEHQVPAHQQVTRGAGKLAYRPPSMSDTAAPYDAPELLQTHAQLPNHQHVHATDTHSLAATHGLDGPDESSPDVRIGRMARRRLFVDGDHPLRTSALHGDGHAAQPGHVDTFDCRLAELWGEEDSATSGHQSTRSEVYDEADLSIHQDSALIHDEHECALLVQQVTNPEPESSYRASIDCLGWDAEEDVSMSTAAPSQSALLTSKSNHGRHTMPLGELHQTSVSSSVCAADVSMTPQLSHHSSATSFPQEVGSCSSDMASCVAYTPNYLHQKSPERTRKLVSTHFSAPLTDAAHTQEECDMASITSQADGLQLWNDSVLLGEMSAGDVSPFPPHHPSTRNKRGITTQQLHENERTCSDRSATCAMEEPLGMEGNEVQYPRASYCSGPGRMSTTMIVSVSALLDRARSWERSGPIDGEEDSSNCNSQLLRWHLNRMHVPTQSESALFSLTASTGPPSSPIESSKLLPSTSISRLHSDMISSSSISNALSPHPTTRLDPSPQNVPSSSQQSNLQTVSACTSSTAPGSNDDPQIVSQSTLLPTDPILCSSINTKIEPTHPSPYVDTDCIKHHPNAAHADAGGGAQPPPLPPTVTVGATYNAPHARATQSPPVKRNVTEHRAQRTYKPPTPDPPGTNVAESAYRDVDESLRMMQSVSANPSIRNLDSNDVPLNYITPQRRAPTRDYYAHSCGPCFAGNDTDSDYWQPPRDRESRSKTLLSPLSFAQRMVAILKKMSPTKDRRDSVYLARDRDDEKGNDPRESYLANTAPITLHHESLDCTPQLGSKPPSPTKRESPRSDVSPHHSPPTLYTSPRPISSPLNLHHLSIDPPDKETGPLPIHPEPCTSPLVMRHGSAQHEYTTSPVRCISPSVPPVLPQFSASPDALVLRSPQLTARAVPAAISRGIEWVSDQINKDTSRCRASTPVLSPNTSAPSQPGKSVAALQRLKARSHQWQSQKLADSGALDPVGTVEPSSYSPVMSSMSTTPSVNTASNLSLPDPPAPIRILTKTQMRLKNLKRSVRTTEPNSLTSCTSKVSQLTHVGSGDSVQQAGNPPAVEKPSKAESASASRSLTELRNSNNARKTNLASSARQMKQDNAAALALKRKVPADTTKNLFTVAELDTVSSSPRAAEKKKTGKAKNWKQVQSRTSTRLDSDLIPRNCRVREVQPTGGTARPWRPGSARDSDDGGLPSTQQQRRCRMAEGALHVGSGYGVAPGRRARSPRPRAKTQSVRLDSSSNWAGGCDYVGTASSTWDAGVGIFDDLINDVDVLVRSAVKK